MRLPRLPRPRRGWWRVLTREQVIQLTVLVLALALALVAPEALVLALSVLSVLGAVDTDVA